jgi:molybdopterin converting factor small subunit
MVHVMVPSMLAAQAGGQQRFEIDAATVGEAIHALPVADLVLNRDGGFNPYLLVYVNATNSLESGGMASPVAAGDEVRIIAILAGG